MVWHAALSTAAAPPAFEHFACTLGKPTSRAMAGRDCTVMTGLRENRTQEGTHRFYRFRTPLRGRTHRFYSKI